MRLSHDVAFSKFSTFFIYSTVKHDYQKLIKYQSYDSKKADQLRYEIIRHILPASLDYEIKKFLANFEIEP